jgi:hypothetical protein
MRIKFAQIVLQRLDADYYNMEATDVNGRVVYKATLPTSEACKVADKYKNVKIK